MVSNTQETSDNIISFEIVNFPYIENQIITFETDVYENSFSLNGKQYFFTKYLVNDYNLPFNPYEIVFLIINGLPFSLEESSLFDHFKRIPSYIYVNYIDGGVIHKYMIKFNKDGIINESLYYEDRGKMVEIKMDKCENNYQSCLPMSNGHWFSRLNYYTFISFYNTSFDSTIYNIYVKIHLNNKRLWSSYEEILTDLLAHKYDVSKIIINENYIKIYTAQDSVERHLEEMDEHFINVFLLLGTVLKTLSLNQGILFISECDLFEDYVIRLVFQLFNKHETNDLASQLVFTGRESRIDKISSLDIQQIDYITKK